MWVFAVKLMSPAPWFLELQAGRGAAFPGSDEAVGFASPSFTAPVLPRPVPPDSEAAERASDQPRSAGPSPRRM